jgi:hypothetical protein
MRCYKALPCRLSSCKSLIGTYRRHPPEICRSGRDVDVVLLVRPAAASSFGFVEFLSLLSLPWLAALHVGRYPRTICSCSDVVTHFASDQQNLSSWPGSPTRFLTWLCLLLLELRARLAARETFPRP